MAGEMVCELTFLQRAAYRLLTPLLTGTGLFIPFIFVFINPLREFDGPAWVSLLVRIGASAFVLGYMGWLTLRVSEVKSWVGVEKDMLQMHSLWGRSSTRPLSEIRELRLIRDGNRPIGARILFKDGIRLNIEGRLGPGFRAILDKS